MINNSFNDDIFNFQEDLKIFVAWFMARNEHKWLATQYDITDSLIEVFERLSAKELKKLMEKHNLRILPRGVMSDKARFHRGSIIEISEHLTENIDHLMASAQLCREMGKILVSHSRSQLSGVELEIAADRFAVNKGFGTEVEKILLNEEEGMEKRLRLVYLTSLVISEELT